MSHDAGASRVDLDDDLERGEAEEEGHEHGPLVNLSGELRYD